MNNNLDEDDLRRIIREAISAGPLPETVLLNRDAVANRLKVSKSTLWRWSRSGYLTAIHIGRAVWYRKVDVERIARGEIIQEGTAHE